MVRIKPLHVEAHGDSWPTCKTTLISKTSDKFEASRGAICPVVGLNVVAADTCAALCNLQNDRRFAAVAANVLDQADRIQISSRCLIEIVYLIEKSRVHPATLSRPHA
jgi:hypothetical protein